jgi:hypothetical protein
MDQRNPNHDQKLLDFVENSSYSGIVNTFMEAGNRHLKLLKLPWGKETTPRAHTLGWIRETVKKYNQLPTIVQTWIQSGRAYIFRRTQSVKEPQGLPGNVNTVTIETSKY